jgi:hypothetical protein
MCCNRVNIVIALCSLAIALLSLNVSEFWKVIYFAHFMLPNMKSTEFGVTNRAFMFIERAQEAQRIIASIKASNLTSIILTGRKGIGSSFIVQKIAEQYSQSVPILYAKGISLPSISNTNPLNSFVELLSSNYLRMGNPRTTSAHLSEP